MLEVSGVGGFFMVNGYANLSSHNDESRSLDHTQAPSPVCPPVYKGEVDSQNIFEFFHLFLKEP
jgi:hypothetical protein